MDSSAESPNLKKLQSELKQNRLVRKRDELLCNLIDECSQDPRISPELRCKIKRIDMVAKSESYMNLESAGGFLLGLPELQYTELNYEERKQIQALLERKIQNLYEKRLHERGNECASDGSLLELHNQLTEQMKLYVNKLLNQQAHLEALVNARINVLPDVSSRIIDHCKLQSKINEQKLIMLTDKLRVDIFLELPPKESFEAYNILIEDINKQQVRCKTDIEELTVLLRKYELASCKEYNDILDTYLKYKNSISKLKLAFNV